MNKWQGTGRLTADPEIRYTNTNPPTCVARFRLAVDRRFKREGEPDADFIGIVAFGKLGEHAEKYYHKGMKVGVVGRIQTGSYDHRDGYKVYTTEIVAEELEFEEKKDASGGGQNAGFAPDNGQGYGYGNGYGNGQKGGAQPQQTAGYAPQQQEPQYQQQSFGEGFMRIPDGVEDEGLPFN